MHFYKIILMISTVFLFQWTVSLAFSDTAPVGPQQFTMKDVEQHNKPEACWIVINKTVYDVTKYLGEHPAPYKILAKACGKDTTKDFNTKKGLGEEHSSKAVKMLEKFRIGILKET